MPDNDAISALASLGANPCNVFMFQPVAEARGGEVKFGDPIVPRSKLCRVQWGVHPIDRVAITHNVEVN